MDGNFFLDVHYCFNLKKFIFYKSQPHAADISNISLLQNYAISLTEQLGIRGPRTAKPLGKSMNTQDLEKLRDEQIYQLYELMMAATGKDLKDNSKPP